MVVPAWVTLAFPSLKSVQHDAISLPTVQYNCIAFAAGVSDEWWEFSEGYRWPGENRTEFIESLVTVFLNLGYDRCADGRLEGGFHKVALYADGIFYTHASRQREDGFWESKLGLDEDIEHEIPESLEGHLYGRINTFMRKART